MVITSTISVLYRLHCVRINALRAFGIHALNAFYMRASQHHFKFIITLSFIVTVGNNVHRCDVTSITRAHVLLPRERCAFHYEIEFPLYSDN